MSQKATFRVPIPAEVQALSGGAPFGYPVGYQPTVSQPVVVPSGKQPTYVLKIDITPIEKATPEQKPLPYAVNMVLDGQPQSIKLDQPITTHVIPTANMLAKAAEVSEPEERSEEERPLMKQLTIKPIDTLPRPGAYVMAYQTATGTSLLPQRQLTHFKNLPKDEPIPFEPITPEEEGAAWWSWNGLRRFFGWDKVASDAELTQKAVIDRQLVQPLGEIPEDGEKVYNWISSPMAGSIEEPKKTKETKETKETVEEAPKRKFSWWEKCIGRSHIDEWEPLPDTEEETASVSPSESESVSSEKTPEFVESGKSSQTIKEKLKREVVYGGTHLNDPKIVGLNKPIKWELYSVQIHTFVPIPGKPIPDFIKNKVDPSVTPLFGAVPLPWDPSKTGNIAMTMRDRLEGRTKPRIPPLFRELFGAQLPADMLA